MSVLTRNCWHNIQQSNTVLESLGKCKTVLQQRHVVLFCSSRCYTLSKLSCHAFPAVYRDFVFTLRCHPSLYNSSSLFSLSCSPLICNLLVPSFSLATFSCGLGTCAARAGEGGNKRVRTGETRQVPASRACVCYRRSLIVQIRQTILRGTWVNCSEISLEPRLSVPDFLPQLWTKSETESLGSR